MTVCVAIKVHDCIVFAADSAVTMGAHNGTTVWEHGLKVFNLHRKLPIVAMTAGLANFGPMSVTTLAKDFRLELEQDKSISPKNYTLEEVVNKAKQFFQRKYEKISIPPADSSFFQFWIGGYSSGAQYGEVWQIIFVNGQSFESDQTVNPETSDRIMWSGQAEAINRLLLGYDSRLISIIQEQIPDVDQQQLAESFLKIQTPLLHASMPVQDAINLADFLVDMTKKYFRFLPGANLVSGDTDIATVTKHEGFKWIRRKHYYSSHLNRGETDHVK